MRILNKNKKKKIRIGFIGYKGFSSKLERLFRSSLGNVDTMFYHPKKRPSGMLVTNRFKDLFARDVIVISSPDKTHTAYIKKLKKFNGYIFCEKIPATNYSDLNYLKKTANKKIYFNFNYRKSELYGLLKKYKKELLYLDFICGHGLAYRKNYAESWRSKSSETPLGVFQIAGIHMIDLLLYVYGKPIKYSYHATKVSPCGKSFDNFYINLVFDTAKKLCANLYFSYTIPYIYSARLISVNSIITADDKAINTYGPRNYVKKGRFAKPPLQNKKMCNFYEESLEKSVKYFCGIVRKNATFKESGSPGNFEGNKFFLEIQDKIKKT